MNEKDKSILRHIAEYCGRLLEYTDGIDESSFVSVQSQADLHKKCDERLRSRAFFRANPFGEHAHRENPERNEGFSRLGSEQF